MYWVVHPLRPRDFSYPSRFPAGLAKSLGRWGCTTQYFPPLSNVLVQHISSISGTEFQSVDVYTHVLHRQKCLKQETHSWHFVTHPGHDSFLNHPHQNHQHSDYDDDDRYHH